MPARPYTDDDPSLAPERTALAWHRTGLAALAAAGVVVKASAPVAARLAMGSIFLALTVGCEAVAWYRGRLQRRAALPAILFGAVVVAVVAAGATATVVGVTSSPD